MDTHSKNKKVTSIDIGTKNLGISVVMQKNVTNQNNQVLIPFPLFMGRFNLSKKKGEQEEVKKKLPAAKKQKINEKGKKKVVKNVDLKVVSYNIHEYLGDDIFHDVDDVIIEKQFTPGKFQGSGQNNRMNSISYMIFQYFVDEARVRGLPKNIVFVQPAARFNLKRLPLSFDPERLDKDKRKEKKYRKKLAIDLTTAYFNEMIKDENKPYYDTNEIQNYLQIISNDKKKKGEDMCDTYLSAVQYLERN